MKRHVHEGCGLRDDTHLGGFEIFEFSSRHRVELSLMLMYYMYNSEEQWNTIFLNGEEYVRFRGGAINSEKW